MNTNTVYRFDNNHIKEHLAQSKGDYDVLNHFEKKTGIILYDAKIKGDNVEVYGRNEDGQKIVIELVDFKESGTVNVHAKFICDLVLKRSDNPKFVRKMPHTAANADTAKTILQKYASAKILGFYLN